MARPRNTSQRRQQIVDGMTTVVAREGYDGASIGEIARAAGLTQGLVHYHFGSKLEIFLSLIESHANAVKERVKRRIEAASSPAAKVDAFIDAHLALDEQSDPRLVACWSVIGAEAVRQPLVREALRQMVEWEIGTLEQLVSASMPADRPASSARAIAAGLFAAIEGYFVLAAASPESIPPGSAALSVRAMAAGLLST